MVISAHVHVLLGDRVMPPSRRRIRLCNGVLMLFATPLIAFAFGILRPGDAHVFTLVWTAIVGLLFIVILLAGLDAVNTLRIHASSTRSNRGNVRRLRAELADIVASANNARVERSEREHDEPAGPGAGDPGAGGRGAV